MNAPLVLFGFLLCAVCFTQTTEGFTAGIGNVGVTGKRSQFQVTRLHNAVDFHEFLNEK